MPMTNNQATRIARACLHKLSRFPFVFLVSMAAGVFISPPLLAATFTVNSTSDAVDANPGDGFCRTSSTGTTCTLRAAVMEANALPGADTIVLSATTYTLSITGSGEDAARRGDLDITGATGNDLTITGPAGAASTTRITAGGSFSGGIDRVFHFLGRNNVTISDVSIQSGSVSGQNGGGINNQTAWVTLKNCQITGNSTSWSDSARSGGQGGGVYNASGGRMTIDNCILRSNQANTSTSASENAFNGGGAIYNSGRMTVSNSTIESNTTSRYGAGAHNYGGDLSITTSIIRSNTGPAIDSSGFGGASGAGGGGGGGVANFGGQVTLRDSWVNQNRSMEGGGIYNFPGGPLSARITIISSAISANSADMWGGGVSNWDRLSVIYSAITNNVVGASGGQFGFNGTFMGEGGGFSNMGIGDLLIQHSTISGNSVARAGGGVFNGSKVRLVHVTLRNNKAASGQLCTGSGGGGFGGGGFGGGFGGTLTACSGSYVFGNELFNSSSASSSNKGIILERTIIGGGASPAGNCFAGDSDTNGFQPALTKIVPFTVTSNGYNIDSGNTCALPTATGTTDRINTDPQLGTLSDFGQGATLPGSTKVPQSIHTPNAGSPAINAIPNASCPKPGIDQRLYIRPEAAGAACDIGAVENSTVKASLADLGLSISSFTSTVTGPTTRAVVGAEIRYDITLKNNGPDEAKGPITVTQSFDGDIVFAGGFSQDPSVTCRQSSNTTITCGKTNGLAKDETVEIALNVKPVIGVKDSLNTTVSVSSADMSLIDHVVDNDSVSLSRSLSSGDPVVNADAGSVNSGGAGAFGLAPLVALAAFGLWRGLRRRP